jgi:hypothetical protein
MYKIYLILIFLVLRITIYNNTIIFLIFNCTATSLFCMHEMHDTPNLRRGISCFLTRFILLPNSRLRAYRYETMETARSRLAASVSSGHAWGCRRLVAHYSANWSCMHACLHTVLIFGRSAVGDSPPLSLLPICSTHHRRYSSTILKTLH